MPVNVAIVGPAGSGKTTLFNALTAGRGSDGVGMVDIPDGRLARLADAVKPAKTTPAQVRVEDTPPGSRAQRVAVGRPAAAHIDPRARSASDPPRHLSGHAEARGLRGECRRGTAARGRRTCREGQEAGRLRRRSLDRALGAPRSGARRARARGTGGD